MGQWRSIFPPIPGSYDILVGSDGTGGGFDFGGLWVQYDIRTGGLLPESFEDIVIAQTFPENQCEFSDVL